MLSSIYGKRKRSVVNSEIWEALFSRGFGNIDLSIRMSCKIRNLGRAACEIKLKNTYIISIFASSYSRRATHLGLDIDAKGVCLWPKLGGVSSGN